MDTNSRHSIIERLYQSPEIDEAISKMQPEHVQEDLKQEMFAVLCSMDADKFQSIYDKGYLKYYLLRMMLNMMQSGRSSFYNAYRRYNEQILSRVFYVTNDGVINARLLKGWYWDEEDAAYKTELVAPPDLKASDPEQDSLWAGMIESAMSELTPKETNIIQLYAEYGNCVTLSLHLRKPARTIRYNVEKIRTKLQKRLRATC